MADDQGSTLAGDGGLRSFKSRPWHFRLAVASLAGRGLLHLAHLNFLDEQFARVGAEMAERLRLVQEAIDRLDTILGIGRYLAEALIAEISTDLTRFPTAAQLTSWAEMCPGAYHLLSRGDDYHELGPRYFDQHDRPAVERRLTHPSEALGNKVTLEPIDSAA